MTNNTRRCIVVSTLKEAEFFADGGFDDITYAMLFTEEKIPRLQTLAQRLEEFHVVLDTEEGVKLLEKQPLDGGKKWSVYLFVDVGDQREGAWWSADSTINVAKLLDKSPAIRFQGIYTHEGHSYNARTPQQIEEVSDQTADRLLHLASRLKELGVECKELAFGSTPTGSFPGKKVQQLTEMHPGNFIFYDLTQMVIGSCGLDDLAVRVMTRVIGRYPGRKQIVIDAGWTALSKHGPLENGSYSLFQGYPGLLLRTLNQEVGAVDIDTKQHSMDEFPVGKRLFLYPYHACSTCAMHRRYYVHRRDDVISTWQPCSNW